MCWIVTGRQALTPLCTSEVGCSCVYTAPSSSPSHTHATVWSAITIYIYTHTHTHTHTHTYRYIYGVFLARKSFYIRSNTVYIYVKANPMLQPLGFTFFLCTLSHLHLWILHSPSHTQTTHTLLSYNLARTSCPLSSSSIHTTAFELLVYSHHVH